MGESIKDGTGRCYLGRVDKSNRVHVRGVANNELDLASEEGRAFQCATSEVTLTSASESAMYYLKNNEDADLVFDAIVIDTHAATGNTEDYIRFTFTLNPTTISDQNAAFCGEVRVGDTGTVDVTHYTGAEGATLTGGTTLPLGASLEVNRFQELKAQTILPKGNALGVSITPPPGNTSLKVVVGVRFYVAPTDAV